MGKKTKIIIGVIIITVLLMAGAFLLGKQNKSTLSSAGQWVLNDDLLRRIMYIEASSAQDLANKLAAYEPQMVTFEETSGIIRKSMADILKYGMKSIIVSDIIAMGSEPKTVMKDVVDYYKNEGYKVTNERSLGRTQVEVEGVQLQKGDIIRIFITKGNYLIQYKTQGYVFSAESIPVKTFNWKLVWVILAIAVIIAGFIFLRKKEFLNLTMKIPLKPPRVKRKKTETK